ncbi:hypothetical protein ACFC0X_19725 [Paenibacillus chitinolyticus]|uniref:hypothetical protein n=1 Tax=Paenibacillus chitinolyticus TaxID=79263 RepID=UPI0035E06073
MLTTINKFREYHTKTLQWVEERKENIPLAKLMLWYLKIPFYARVLLFILVSIVSHSLFFNVGFIILQSKAKNEVLSLVTAYHNPINFSSSLYYHYSFIYLFIFLLTIIPIILLLFGSQWLYTFKLKPIIHEKFTDFKARILIYVFLMIIWLLLADLLGFVLIKVAPMLPYFLLHASKNSAILELAIKWQFKQQNINWSNERYTYDSFQEEILISLQIGNILMVVLLFMIYFININFKKFEEKNENLYKLDLLTYSTYLFVFSKYDFFLVNLLVAYQNIKLNCYRILYWLSIIIFSFCIITIFVSHTAYQLGSFGKSLTQFETDRVEIKYLLNGNIVTSTGFRVFQDKGYIVLRSDDGAVHYIQSEQIEVNSIMLE